MLPAVLDGFRRDTRCSLGHGLVHPHPANPGGIALVHDPLGSRGPRDDDHAIDPAGDGFEVGVAALAFKRLHVRIHRENLVPGLLQPLIDQIADRVVAVVARYPGDGDTFLSEEVVHPGFESGRSHRPPFAVTSRAAEQIVSMSWGDSFVSGRRRVYGPGILPLVASSQEANRNVRCTSGGYDALLERLIACRPSDSRMLPLQRYFSCICRAGEAFARPSICTLTFTICLTRTFACCEKSRGTREIVPVSSRPDRFGRFTLLDVDARQLCRHSPDAAPLLVASCRSACAAS